ncbi:hypothetical protein F0342_13165 [Bacillus sp. CH30_1T]|nr:hypothetical protein F0342_13165 [Bacillus sp. CH30_1T]
MDCSGRHLTPAGNRGKVETPQGKSPRRLDFLPAESKCLERKGTVYIFRLPLIQKKNLLLLTTEHNQWERSQRSI